MAYGSGVYGEGLYGGAPDPEKFEEQSEQEKNEDYRELYNKLEEVDEELKKQKNDTERWRRNSWFWRAGSFVAGNGTGLIISVLI